MERSTQYADYTYEPLDKEMEQIRIFTLRPGTGSEPLKGSLSIVTLKDPEQADILTPDYEALSYCWGKVGKT